MCCFPQRKNVERRRDRGGTPVPEKRRTPGVSAMLSKKGANLTPNPFSSLGRGEPEGADAARRHGWMGRAGLMGQIVRRDAWRSVRRVVTRMARTGGLALV